jgi:hypothetical protein
VERNNIHFNTIAKGAAKLFPLLFVSVCSQLNFALVMEEILFASISKKIV